MFENQEEAALSLAEILPKEELNANKYLLIALSLDGVLLCDKIAQILRLDYELFFSASIGAPKNEECEIASVSESEEIVLNDALIKSFDITEDFVYGQAKRVYEEKILKQVYKYRKGNLLSRLKGRNILLVNDGCQSGGRLAVAAKSMAALGAKNLALACAFMPEDLAVYAREILDEVYCLKKIPAFVSMSFYYKNKIETSEAGILKILEESPYYLPLQKAKEQPKE